MKRKAASGIMLTILVLSVLTFAFNGRPVKAQPTLTVIGPWSGAELDKFLPVLEAFEAGTGINVTYNNISSYELAEILPEMFEAETTPGDVIFMWPWFIRQIGPQGHAFNVTGLIDEADFRPGVLDEVKVDGTLYGGAYTGKAKPGFWYRQSFFEANNLTEPTTWEEFVALLDFIATIEGIVNPIVSGDAVGWPLSDVVEHFLITFGNPQLQRDLISGDAKWIRPPVSTIFFDKLVPLLEAGFFSEPIEWTAALESWWAGNYGLYFMGSWITGMVDSPEDLGVFSLPGTEGVVFAADYFFIPRYTEYPEEAELLFQFLAGTEAQEPQVEQGGHIATNIHVPLEAYPPVDRMVAELMEGMEVLPDLDDAIGGEFQTTFWDQLKLLWVEPGLLDEVLAAIQEVAPAKTWTVDDDGPADFHIIQEAINAATDRDTIFVYSGIYYENVVVNKTVSLIGEDISSTIVDGVERGHVFNITRDNAKITGFTIRNSGNPSAGIYLDNVNHCDIIENDVINNAHGIWLWNSSENRISGNNVVNNDHGIYLEISSNHNRIYGNYLTTNYNGSIAFYASSNNRISWNNMTNSSTCVMLSSSFDNILSGNHLTNNVFGVFLVSSEINTFYHNNFIDNDEQVYSYESVNIWDDGYPSGGNYWSDYTGTDSDGDGIGDTPYPTGLSDQDNYPLMEPWAPPRIYVNPLISYAGVGDIFSANVRVADVTNLYSFAFVLGYNTVFLDAIDIVIGPFLNEPLQVLRAEIHDEDGFVWVDVTSQPPAEEVDGSGTLATITFRVRGLGECFLDLYDTELSESDGFPIVHSVEDGFYESGMTQVVSTESTLGSYHASLAVDLAGNVHVAWHDLTDLECGIDWDIFYKRYEVGVGWTPTEVVSNESNGTSAYPSLAVDSGGNVHVAWHDNTTDYGGSGSDWDIFYKRREVEGGWTETEVVSTESTGNSFYPSLAVDSGGNIHIAWEDETNYDGSGSDWDIFYKRYEVGVGWTPTEVVSINNKDSYDPSLAVDSGGNIHIAWEDYTGGPGSGSDLDIFYRRFDAGVGWAETEVVSTESTEDSYDPSLAVDSGGNVHVAWEDDTGYAGSGTDRDIFYKSRTSSWSITEVVSIESTDDSWVPSLAVDSSRNVHIAWDDRGELEWTVFYKRYEVGINWTKTAVVSTESTAHSWVACLAVDSSRNVHIAWHDETDYAGCGSDVDIFYKYRRVHSTQYSWPMFRQNLRHTGYTESPAPRTNQTLWNYTTGGDVYSSPAVADGRVYVGSWDNKTYCLDASTGALIWNYTTSDVVSSSPAVAYGKVYIGSYDYKVYCLDASTGTLIWNYTTGGPVISSPAIADGKVFVGSGDGYMYALDQHTGILIWKYPTGAWVEASPAVNYGRVYVGSTNGKVYCLDASTGTLIWNYTTGGPVYTSPAVFDGKVYIGSWDSKVYCLNASAASMTPDEREIWNYTTGDLLASSPAVAYGKVYVGTYFYYPSHGGKVYCLDASIGTHVWNKTIGDLVQSSPAVADGKVYVGSNDNKIYCFDASTGAPVWNYTTGGDVYSSPAVADGIVFVGSHDNTVYAFGSIIRVPEDYPTIQEAIEAADPGDIISIAPGTYHESLVIDKPLTILGRKGSSTDFEGGGSGIAVNITNTYEVTVTNIIITNWEQGIFIDNSSDCQIYGNVMFYMVESGIALEGNNAANNLIESNTIYSNNIAINVAESSNSNTIYNNTISLNIIGLNLQSSGNTIYANTISQNEIGINMTYSNSNNIYWNNFMSSFQVHIETSGYVNIWDDGYPSGGNYWSDYEERYPSAQEYGNSGIWNTPYVIDEYNVDNYPLMNPIHEISVTKVTPYKTVVGQGYSLKINVTVANKGRAPEDFELTLYANTTVITKLTDIFLESGKPTTITFTWNTIGVAYGNYTISAIATTVLGETDTTDNTLVDGTVFVTILGDIRGPAEPDHPPDGIVDMWDFGFMGLAYGKTSADPDWDIYKIADIRGPEDPEGSGLHPPDGVVDMWDFGYCGLQYGKYIYD